jgi:hypothetical protein
MTSRRIACRLVCPCAAMCCSRPSTTVGTAALMSTCARAARASVRVCVAQCHVCHVCHVGVSLSVMRGMCVMCVMPLMCRAP